MLQEGALPGLIMLELRRLWYATMQMLWIEHLISWIKLHMKLLSPMFTNVLVMFLNVIFGVLSY